MGPRPGHAAPGGGVLRRALAGVALAALAVGWLWAAWRALGHRRPHRIRPAGRRRRAGLRPQAGGGGRGLRARRALALPRVAGGARGGARALRAPRCALRARVRGRTDRDRLSDRDDGAGARLDRAAAVRPRRAVVVAPARRARDRLHRLPDRELLRPWRDVPVHLLRPAGRDGARARPANHVVAAGRGGVRGAHGPVLVGGSLPDAGSREAGRGHGRGRPRAGQGDGRARTSR